MRRTVRLPLEPFSATVGVPGDKSLSHRALILAAMARGRSEVRGAGPGADVASTRRVVASLGVHLEGVTITSAGVAAWTAPDGPLDCGNSGTTLRLCAGALVGRPFASTLVGDASLSARPMRRLEAPLRSLGGVVAATGPHGTPPVTVGGGAGLIGTSVTVDLASAQVRSAFELAAIQADGASKIDGPAGARDHTERWLESFGLGRRLTSTLFEVLPGGVPEARYDVPGDPSSAAFLWALAAARRGAQITTKHVSLNPGRIGFLQIIEMFGAEVTAEVTGQVHGDPVGTVTVRGHGLFGIDVSGELSVAALDELPLVGVLGALAEGITTVRDAGELRAKESDRIAATVGLIRALGGGAEPTDDGFAVVGTGFLEPGLVETVRDHRIAMAAGVAAIGVPGDVVLDDATVASVSWPGFFEVVEGLWS
jgi:3-phosphoshikimate 1-carboxyvinyltransferase